MLGLRERRRWLAVATFVLLSAAVGSNVAVHGMGAHDDHGPLLVVHDASSHAFTDGSAAPHSEALHCVLCHLTRILRPVAQAAHQAPSRDDRTTAVRRPTLEVPAIFPAAEPPLRSPPVSL